MTLADQFAAVIALPLGRLLLAMATLAVIGLPVQASAVRWHRRRAEAAVAAFDRLRHRPHRAFIREDDPR